MIIHTIRDYLLFMFFSFFPRQCSHLARKTFKWIKFQWYNTFRNLALTIVDYRNIHCNCYMKDFEVWETIAVIISIFQTTCVILGGNMAINVYEKWKESIMFYLLWHKFVPSWFNSYALELVLIFYSAIKHGYRCFISLIKGS